MKYCDDLPTDVKRNCCGSCHEDIEYGFDLSEMAYRGETYEVCCTQLSIEKAGEA